MLLAICMGLVAAVVLAVFAPRGRTRCGDCAFFDEALHHCLMRDFTTGRDTRGCITHKKRTE